MTTEAPPGSYEALMEDGVKLFNAGILPTAVDFFDRATKLDITHQEAANAFHQLGLVLTKQRKLRDARVKLEVATGRAILAGNMRQKLALKRDLAWTYMTEFERNPFASRLLLKADELLHDAWNGFCDIGDRIEMAVTEGYLGRIDLLMGDRRSAAERMRTADADLSTLKPRNATYILNNMMWLLRAVPPNERETLKVEIDKLIVETGQTSRYDEVRVIMLGGDKLYRLFQLIPRSWLPAIKRVVG